MKKREFLQKLKEYLSYELPRQNVEKNVDFYSDYIEREISSGKSVDEVLTELGDPQLIARSIVDAAKSGDDGIPNTPDDVDYTSEVYGNGRQDEASGTGYGGEEGYGSGEGYGGSPFRGWYVYNGGCFTWLLLVLIIFCFFSFIGAIIGFLSPVLVPICIVLLIAWLLSRRND